MSSAPLPSSCSPTSGLQLRIRGTGAVNPSAPCSPSWGTVSLLMTPTSVPGADRDGDWACPGPGPPARVSLPRSATRAWLWPSARPPASRPAGPHSLADLCRVVPSHTHRFAALAVTLLGGQLLTQAPGGWGRGRLLLLLLGHRVSEPCCLLCRNSAVASSAHPHLWGRMRQLRVQVWGAGEGLFSGSWRLTFPLPSEHSSRYVEVVFFFKWQKVPFQSSHLKGL